MTRWGRVGEGQGGRSVAEEHRPLAPRHVPWPRSGPSSWGGEGAGQGPGTQGPSRADRIAADAAADVGGCWPRETSSRLHTGGTDEKEEVNSGA